MLDPVEFLARGIAAFRSGDFEQAIFDFKVAAQIDPYNPRAWLWLAAAYDSPDQQRDCLLQALCHDPGSYVAKTLLQRLEQANPDAQVVDACVRSFECHGCGGQVRFDPDRSALVCSYCGLVEMLAEPAGPVASANPGRHPDRGAWALQSGQFSCEKCGAAVLAPAKDLAVHCPFCGSVKVLGQSLTPGLILPHSLIPFQLEDEETACRAVLQWVGKGLLIPDELADHPSVQVEVEPIYLPFWNFSGQVQVRISQQKEPQPLSDYARIVVLEGQPWYEQDVAECLIYASKSLPGNLLEKAFPFDLAGRVPFQVEQLAGWQAETYQVAPEDAVLLAKKRIRDAGVRNAQREMLLFHPERLMAEDVYLSHLNGELILLPIWTGKYTYKKRVYPVLVNGQTGEVASEKPVDVLKLWLVGGIGLVLALLLLGLLIILWGASN